MAEKKISKTEQRKLDAANKKEFIGKAFQTALNALAENTVDVTGGGVKVQISFTNHNRYVHISAYGRSTSILIYRDGNVEIKLKESCHNPHEEQLFEFSLDKEVQERFLIRFREILSWLIPVSFGHCQYDFHTFMDYASGQSSIETVYRNISEEWGEVDCRKK